MVAVLALSACAHPLGAFKTVSWKEEALLHDRRILIVERSLTYDEGPHGTNFLDEEWRFEIPGTGQWVTWTNNLRTPPIGSSLTVIVLDILGDVPYLVTAPRGCIAYNYWRRPNPPYVAFRFRDGKWQQIAYAERPAELKQANVVVGEPEPKNRSGVLSVAVIKEENRLLQSHLRVLADKPVNVGDTVDCGEMVFDGQGGWLGIGWFTRQPSYDACTSYCTKRKIAPEYCPCDELFRGRK
jgi:hypothetical protein